MMSVAPIEARVPRVGGRLFTVAVVLCTCLSLLAMRSATAQARPFAIEQFSVQTTMAREVPEQNGYTVVNEPYSFTQAGGHPDGLTTRIVFASEEFNYENAGKEVHVVVPTQDPKDVVVDVPPGLIGDPMAVPRCSLTNVTDKKIPCPASTQVGMVRSRISGGGKEVLGPVYNVVPEAGQSAEFALVAQGLTVLATAHLVRAGKGAPGEQPYGITVVSNGMPAVQVLELEVTFWGVPAEAKNDWLRGLSCSTPEASLPLCNQFGGGGGEKAGIEEVPFITMPTDCAGGASVATARADSWEHPGGVEEGRYEKYVERAYTMPAVTGCNLLKFGPEIGVRPDTLLADAPVGLSVNVVVPQSEQPGTLGTPHLRKATVTLPLGMSVSPGIVDGIEACERSGPHGIDFTGPESEEPGLNGELQLAPGHCPDASTVGEAEAETPLLPSPVKGHVYLARPGCGGAGQAPCTEQDALDGNLFKLYLELGGVGALGDAGVNVKVEGRVEANPATGQLTAVFDENPQVPFSELRLRMSPGPRSPLDNPAACGAARTAADFMPWSASGLTPEGLFVTGTPDATPSSSYEVQGCASSPGLSPGFVAGTVTPQAGKFSSFTMNLARQDREQYVKGIQLHTPPGLLAMLSSVPLCPETQANDPSLYGECTASKIGTTRVASGAGSHPFEIEGNVYLTGPHDGAPFGLSIVTHAVAGPFNLGLVVVRARIDIDPTDSTATITTDETGPYAVPQIIFGVPLRLKRITVNIDRPGFMFNPTSCAAQQITAAISGSQEAVAHVASPFAVGACKSLAFKPSFTVSTNGHTSRANGASLDAKVSYPKGAMGNDANIAYVKVSLPRQLPSRLTTLQKACPAATFDANPGACPKESVVGISRTTTPLLPVQLEGPVYFVSHGGEAFPNLIVVLQGDGVRVDLVGDTFINKAGITSSTFKTVPDVPVNSFELYLPQGKFSALAANGNLCKVTKTVTTRKKVERRVKGRTVTRTVKVRRRVPGLVMPTEFVGQNGAVIKQSTNITVTGCARNKAKSARRAKQSRRTAHAVKLASTNGRRGR